jgi:2,4-dienoyl-CoA reductase-like NADH-dependent reductase (Old Yellow Enzyme family)
MDDFAVMYRWKLKPGLEDSFVEGWSRVTEAVHRHCGSFGSRLHRCADGTWLAYARWPDAETRDRCFSGPDPLDPEGSRMMNDAVAERYPEVVMSVLVDLLREPDRG